MSGGFAYLDSSAFLKLFFHEPESDALEVALTNWQRTTTSSELLAIEAHRAVARAGVAMTADIDLALGQVTLVPMSDEVRSLACAIGPPTLRALDAIHLATAEAMRADIGAIFTYDRRLAEAAATLDLPILSPA